MDKCCTSPPTIGFTEGWDKWRSTGKENEATAHLYWTPVKKYWTLPKSQSATCKANEVDGWGCPWCSNGFSALAFENTARTCSVLCEPTNPTYMKAPSYCHTGFTRRHSQCHCAPSCRAHHPFLYGQSGQTPPSSTAGRLEQPRRCPRSAAERTRQNAGRDCRGWAGRWQCRAGHRRRSRGHGRQLIQGYSSWMLLAAPEPEGWSTARTLGYAKLQVDNFPPAVWVKQSTESTWLHNISLMPEEFAEPANDAVLLDWRWYFFIVLEVMSMHQECKRKTQIVMRGSERLWLNYLEKSLMTFMVFKHYVPNTQMLDLQFSVWDWMSISTRNHINSVTDEVWALDFMGWP